MRGIVNLPKSNKCPPLLWALEYEPGKLYNISNYITPKQCLCTCATKIMDQELFWMELY